MSMQPKPPIRFPSTPPATLVLSLAVAVGFLTAWTTGAKGLLAPLFFTGDFSKPWSLVTYPFAMIGSGGEFFFVLFEVVWLVMVGGWIESNLGARSLIAWFMGSAAGAAVLAWLVGMSTGAKFALVGPWIPVATLTGLWAGKNPFLKVLFMFVINLEARWLALIVGLSVVFVYGTGNPPLGFAVALPVLFAWLFARGFFGRKPKPVVSARGQRSQSNEEFEQFITKVRNREKDREERERLRNLLEGGPQNGSSDPEN